MTPAVRRDTKADGPDRWSALSRRSLLTAAAVLAGAPTGAQARDYASRREALDELDRLSSQCGMRLGALRRSRANADVLASRFLTTLEKHRAERDATRRRFALPQGARPETQVGEVDSDLTELRQALDDLMIAYAESLPVFGDSKAVSRLAVCMVEVSKLRTVIDLWAIAEAS